MYNIDQKVCLWQIQAIPGSRQIVVLKEVIVTITEMKTGAPGEHSREPSSLQSLRGIGDDGNLYEKHWEEWPESQTNDFQSQWNMRDDGVGEGVEQYWIPMEAVYVYNSFSKVKAEGCKLIDINSADILPKGDISYCEEHDRYTHGKGTTCFFCKHGRRVA